MSKLFQAPFPQEGFCDVSEKSVRNMPVREGRIEEIAWFVAVHATHDQDRHVVQHPLVIAEDMLAYHHVREE
jgi:hypothetical protein